MKKVVPDGSEIKHLRINSERPDVLADPAADRIALRLDFGSAHATMDEDVLEALDGVA